MAICDIALRVLDQMIAHAQENEKAHGAWWEPEPIALTPPTARDIANKRASVERRLEKAEQAFEAALTPEEMEWHSFLKSEPKTPEDIETRKQVMARLYKALDADEQKLDLYRNYKKLDSQKFWLSTGILGGQLQSEEAAHAFDEPANHFTLCIDYPNEVETSHTASAVSKLLLAAFQKAGYGYEECGLQMPASAFDYGKLALRINDSEDGYDLIPESLAKLDWAKIRDALIALKPVVQSADDWHRRPTSQGDVMERMVSGDDLQMQLLDVFNYSDAGDVSHWDDWRPKVPGKKNIEPLSVSYIDPDGKDLDFHKLTEQESHLEHGGSPDDEFGIIDNSKVCKKAVVSIDAAGHYLRDYLGIEGLDLSQGTSRGKGKSS